ncbi:ABC transporter permease [Acidipropionibacterium jensenii]|uniref:ABC transporter permease n=1 Tax=Acidipropionibacterium jensenii TaxID=1749 RepID=UPI0026484EA6|nr:FtsX-like permease family protein [Acidipropionibacterium jensenii]MDN6593321.1 FtsX-like permease family protein [Acidipropionibacterium jensenii]
MTPERRRLIPTILAVLLGVAFLAATLIMSATMKASITSQTAASVEGADAVVVADPSTTLPVAATQAISRASGVTGVDPTISTTLRATHSGGMSMVEGHLTPSSGQRTLVSGRLPRSAGEALVNPLMIDAGVRQGSTLTLLGVDNAAKPQQVRVVGVIAPAPRVSMNTDSQQVYTDSRTLMAARGTPGYDTVYVTGTGGQQAVAQAVKKVPGMDAAGITVRTADAERAELTRQSLAGSGALTGFMGAFAAIAVAVAAIVIVNTFAILVAQRTRSLALARCVGATRRQVRNSVLIEALATGVIGSILGLTVGTGLSQLLVSLGRSRMNLPLQSVITLDPVSLLAPAAVGILVTVLAALPPARRATRVPPVAALSPVSPDPTRRVGRVRLAIGAVLFVAGAGLLVYGAIGTKVTGLALVAGIAGGLASFVGVLILAIVVIPRLALSLGRLAARLGGVPAELATENTQRNPGRAASTVSALLVGVTLIVMTAVGAATAQTSVNKTLDEHFPTDAIVTSDSGRLPDRLLDAARGADGVAAAGEVSSGQATLTAGGRTQRVDVAGYSAGALAALRDTEALARLDDRHVVVRAPGVTTGQKVTIRNGQRSLELVAVAQPTDQRAPSIALSAATMKRVLPDAVGSQILVRYAAGTSPSDATASITRAISPIPGASIISAASSRDEIQRVVTIMLALVIGLLAISVVIALVGVGNTLGLSVLERTREIGLLRALGLTRRQVRAMFGHEAVLESVAAVVVGLVLGTGYGIAGTYAMLGSQGADVIVSLPWLQLAAVAAIAMAAGWLASVIPGRHAARVSPSVALAGE